MTAPTLDETATVRDLLFGDVPSQPTDEIADSLRQHGTVRGLVPGVAGLSALVEREVASATDGLLSLNLADLAAAGWKKYEALRQAAKRTRDKPTAEEIVALTTHQIESGHHPSIDVSVDGKTIATVKIDLQLTYTMAGVLAVIRQARLTAIRSGTCTVAGSLAIQQTSITKKQKKFDLPGVIRLRNGVQLLTPFDDALPVQSADAGDAETRPTSAAWYSDPTKRFEFRWWDGSHWTERVATKGRALSDPVFDALNGYFHPNEFPRPTQAVAKDIRCRRP